MKKILVINTGSTSTKVAIFHDTESVFQDNLVMPEEILRQCEKTVEQLPFRTELLQNWLNEKGYAVKEFDMIAARGGPLPPVKGGAYAVNDLMVDVLTFAPASRHESALACMIGKNISGDSGVPVIIYDSVSVDELKPVAKMTGLPEFKNRAGGHILNTRKVGRNVAESLGKEYKDCTFVIIHLGGSITVTAHDRGEIVDFANAFNGPMSTQRAGMIQSDALIRLCYSGQYTMTELLKKLNGGGGFAAYFGTQNAKVVSEKLDAGDELAKQVTDTLVYQACKAIGSMAIACDHPVDRIIMTGGMAHFKYVADEIVKRTEKIAPFVIIPGEFEMEALCEGALNVLAGKEVAKEYDVYPLQYPTEEAFMAAFGDQIKKAHAEAHV